ncbi:MAG: (Fe-S)-binding protein [Chloroflexota bacterium]
MTIGSKPDWITGIAPKLDYHWRYKRMTGILPEISIVLDQSNDELNQALAAAGIDDSPWASCFQCGTCRAVCPYTQFATDVSGLSARRMLHEAQLGLTDFENGQVWTCTTCDTCVEQCPRGVEIIDFMKSLRRVGVELGAGKVPDSLRRAMTSITAVGNPFGEAREKRAEWAENLAVKPFARGMELLYFPGCFPAYDARARKVARAIARILEKAGVDFGILGSQEDCCGESVRKAGYEELFQSLVQHNTRTFADHGVNTIVTTSPHCYHTFKSEYPQFGGDFEVIHYTQYLARLIRQGRLKFSRELNRRVTYHDPCYLGRHNGIYEEPREVLRSIPGLELVEMPDSRRRSLCCGGGGGGIWLDTRKGERLSDLRLAQAMQTGAGILAVACPYCLINFEDARLTVDNGDNIEVQDIAELVWDAMF